VTGQASGLGCWFLGGDDLTLALHNLLSPPPPSSLASIKPANPGSHGKMAIKTERYLLKYLLFNYRFFRKYLTTV